MLFSDIETSVADGRPFRLYLFERGATRWAYTNADHDIDFQATRWQAIAIADDGLRVTGETSANQLTLTLPDDLEVVRMFRGVAPSEEIWLTVRDSHFGLPDDPASAAVVWVGSARAIRRPEPGKAEIVCNSLSASMGNDGLRLSFERNCPHSLYDGQCRVARETYKIPCAITSMDGAQVTVNTTLANIYTGGVIEWRTGFYTERRGIEAQTVSTLALLGGTAGLDIGLEVSLFPGCDQTSATCNGRFANMLNYGGFRHMPGKSPFDGEPIY
ncbi:MAG: phage BR0599 family protein [Zoogloeaceae bacterium]|jgi:uncharacterized phage protein (TIGR02218 family)|nr:phage BR0599 family protein [Zoogloeaceae bacterium]